MVNLISRYLHHMANTVHIDEQLLCLIAFSLSNGVTLNTTDKIIVNIVTANFKILKESRLLQRNRKRL